MKKAIPRQVILNPVARFAILGVSTGLGLGYMPVAPGTFGSLLGIPLGLALATLSPMVAYAISFVLFFVFAAAADRACRHWGQSDSGRVVSDEVLGQAIALVGARSVLAGEHYLPKWGVVVGAFLLFRLFDIFKPFPARTFDRMESGFGVVADDVVAGLYAAFVVWGLSRISMS